MVALDELVDSWMIDLARKIAFHFKQDGLVVMKRRDEEVCVFGHAAQCLHHYNDLYHCYNL